MCDLRHRQKKSQRRTLEWQEIEVRVEGFSLLVFCINDHGHRAYCLGALQAAPQGIGKQESASTLSRNRPVYRQSAKQRDRQMVIARQFPGRLRRQFAQGHQGCRQRVEAFDDRFVVQQDKWRGDMPLCVLSSLLFEVLIERRIAAVEGVTAVVFVERLNRIQGQ